MKKKITITAMYMVLIFLGITTILPFIWMILSSFKTNAEINALQQSILPKAFTIENYVRMNENFDFIKFFINSLFLSGVVTIFVAFTSTVCGYVLSKYKFKGRDLIFGYIVATMMIPWVVTIIPQYTIIRKIGWMNKWLAIIVPAMFSGFGIFMLRQYCTGIPDELLEAARVDGANEFYIVGRIVFPLCRNAISSIAIFQFLWMWENYLWPFLVLSDESKQVLAVGLRMFEGRYDVDYGGMFAATSISIIPVIVVYIIFQRRFIDGISASGIKG